MTLISFLRYLTLIFVFAIVVSISAQEPEDKVYFPADVDQKAEITKRGKVNVSGECGTGKDSFGRARVKIVLNKSGKVTTAELVEKSNCDYFNDRVVEVAKEVKFKPALIAGKPVSQFITLAYEYKFVVVK